MTYQYTPRGTIKTFHKSLYYEVKGVICHCCENNGECPIAYQCEYMITILQMLFRGVTTKN